MLAIAGREQTVTVIKNPDKWHRFSFDAHL